MNGNFGFSLRAIPDTKARMRITDVSGLHEAFIETQCKPREGDCVPVFVSIDIQPLTQEKPPTVAGPLTRSFTHQELQRFAAFYAKNLQGVDKREMLYTAGLLLDFIETFFPHE